MKGVLEKEGPLARTEDSAAPRLAGMELRLQVVVGVERTFCDRTESRKAFSSR